MTRNIVPIKWFIIGYIVLLSLLSPIYVLLFDYIYEDLESIVVLLMHLLVLPVLIISVIQSLYIKWWVIKSHGFKRIALFGDRIKKILIWTFGLLHFIILGMFLYERDVLFLCIMILIYIFIVCINFPDLYISREYLILNNQIYETKNIRKIKENNFRVYIKLNDNTVHRIWCRNPKVALDIERSIQVLIYENNLNTYHKI